MFLSRGSVDFEVVEWDSEALESIEEAGVEGSKVMRDLCFVSGSFGGAYFESE